MSLMKSVKSILKDISKLHVEDPKIYELWDSLTKVLSENKSLTIAFLSELDDEEMVDDLSSVFDDVSRNFQSKELIRCYELLQERFPSLNLAHMVQAARDCIIED